MRVIFHRKKDIDADNLIRWGLGVFFAKQDKNQKPDPKIGYFGNQEYYISIHRKHDYHPEGISFNKKEWNCIKESIDGFIKEEENIK